MSMINKKLFDNPTLFNSKMMESNFNKIDWEKLKMAEIESGWFNYLISYVFNEGYIKIFNTQDYKTILKAKKEYKNAFIIKEYIPALYNIFKTKPIYHLFVFNVEYYNSIGDE